MKKQVTHGLAQKLPNCVLLWAVTVGSMSAPSQLRVILKWLLLKVWIQEQGLLSGEVPGLLPENAENDLRNLRKMQS